MISSNFANPIQIPGVTADAIVCRDIEGILSILLVTRKGSKENGKLALPGGFIEYNESPENGVLRELFEETSLKGIVKQLVCVKGDKWRGIDRHVVTIAYEIEEADKNVDPMPGDDAAAVKFYSIKEIINQKNDIAFDHYEIICDYLHKINWNQEPFIYHSDTHLKPDLKLLDKSVQKGILTLSNPNFFLEPTLFAPYDAEGIKDHSWGCAWRCIQSVVLNLDNQQKEKRSLPLSMIDIFFEYGSFRKLMAIIKNKNVFNESCIMALKNKKWAPYDHEECWAEPIVGYLICKKFNIECDLFLLNGYSVNFNAPSDAFNKTVSFQVFWEEVLLKNKQNNGNVIMIDDGIVSLLVVGAEVVDKNIRIHFFDPHTLEDTTPIDSYYTCDFDLDGNFIKTQCTEEHKKKLFVKTMFARLFFKDKKWMILTSKINQVINQTDFKTTKIKTQFIE